MSECLPRKLKQELYGHEVLTVPQMGWAGTKNGALLKLAETQFDIFMTIDSNLEFQHPIEAFNIAIIALVAKSNDIDTLRPLMPEVIKILPDVEKGKVRHVEIGVETPSLEQSTKDKPE
jgi:hypothetical protein